jgi:hypothetical protein
MFGMMYVCTGILQRSVCCVSGLNVPRGIRSICNGVSASLSQLSPNPKLLAHVQFTLLANTQWVDAL